MLNILPPLQKKKGGKKPEKQANKQTIKQFQEA